MRDPDSSLDLTSFFQGEALYPILGEQDAGILGFPIALIKAPKKK